MPKVLVDNPFVSEAQRSFMYTNMPEMARRWEKAAPKGNLPKRKRKAAVKNARRVKLARVDPTRTADLRCRFVTVVRRLFNTLKARVLDLVVKQDCFGLDKGQAFGTNVRLHAIVHHANPNHDERILDSPRTLDWSDRVELLRRAPPTMNSPPVQGIPTSPRWQFYSGPEKVKAFMAWLKQQVSTLLAAHTSDELWRMFVEEGMRKGASRAFDDVWDKDGGGGKTRWGPGEGDFYQGSKRQFMQTSFGQPESYDKVMLLAQRSYSDLKGVTEVMSTAMSRVLVDGLIAGDGPRKIGRELAKQVDDIGLQRGTTIARTEIIRAHAEGQLHAMEELGIEDVGVQVEFSSTGDDLVCPECQDLEGTVLPVDEAHGIIPVHPNCRCAWIPFVPKTQAQNRRRRAITCR
jgi:SPP1 gp7 family putative phage head morphogenesis protein